MDKAYVRNQPSRHAFSLVELSIVLVILGLLVGGILSGQALIRASELRATASELQRYTAATHTFRDKYFALPGDMANATSFWGTAAACPGTSATPRTTAATCNGNGDGWIAGGGAEMFSFWQHLANAGLIEGSYTGVTDHAVNPIFATLGKNIPASKLSKSGWFPLCCWGTSDVTNVNLFEGYYGNLFTFGGAGNNYTEDPTLKAEEAWNTDTKLDDGKPGTGKIRGLERHTNCQDAGVQVTAIANTANYKLSDTSANACALLVDFP